MKPVLKHSNSPKYFDQGCSNNRSLFDVLLQKENIKKHDSFIFQQIICCKMNTVPHLINKNMKFQLTEAK